MVDSPVRVGAMQKRQAKKEGVTPFGKLQTRTTDAFVQIRQKEEEETFAVSRNSFVPTTINSLQA
jgi:hypothetical protein